MRLRFAMCPVLVGAFGCTFAFPFEEADTQAGAGCGDCGLCACVSGDAHDPSTPTAARPYRDCCTDIDGDFAGTSLDDWYVFHLSAGEQVVVNACSTSTDLHFEVSLYAPAEVAPGPELDREIVDGRNCAPSMLYRAASDGDHTIRVRSRTGVGGSYSIVLSVS